jgi:hypothetical protein
MFRKIKFTFYKCFGSGSGLGPKLSFRKRKKEKLSWFKSSLLGQRLLLEPECPLKGFQKIHMTAFDKKNIFPCLKKP